MGHVSILLDEMGLDKMGLDKKGINRLSQAEWEQNGHYPGGQSSKFHCITPNRNVTECVTKTDKIHTHYWKRIWKFKCSSCLRVSPDRWPSAYGHAKGSPGQWWQKTFTRSYILLIDLPPLLRAASHTISHPTSCAIFATKGALSNLLAVTLSQSWRKSP